MELKYTRRYVRDIQKVRDNKLRDRVLKKIQGLKAAPAITERTGAKKLKSVGNSYSVRIGDYRLGIVLEEGVAVLERFLHRRDFYRSFP